MKTKLNDLRVRGLPFRYIHIFLYPCNLGISFWTPVPQGLTLCAYMTNIAPCVVFFLLGKTVPPQYLVFQIPVLEIPLFVALMLATPLLQSILPLWMFLWFILC